MYFRFLVGYLDGSYKTEALVDITVDMVSIKSIRQNSDCSP